MKYPPLLPCGSALLCTLLISACASKGKSKSVGAREGNGPTMQERMGKWDMDRRSNFEKSVGKAGANKGFKTTAFHRQSDFKTGSEFSGSKDKFNAKGFAQSDKPAHDRDKVFSGANDRSKIGDATFKTKESRLGSKTVRDSDKVSAQGDDVFRTYDNRMGTKGLEESKRPLIQDHPESYTEGQIRSLLNKG